MARRRGNYNSDSKDYDDWMDCCEEDMLAARLLAHHDGCYNAAAFHCQQTIEKALKAYILLKTNVLVDGHNLTWLCKQAMKHNQAFNQWLDESASLNRCYIETRYPADIPLDLTRQQISRYYDMAYEMFAFIRKEVQFIVHSS
jgi:HEPN domain-containing protein